MISNWSLSLSLSFSQITCLLCLQLPGMGGLCPTGSSTSLFPLYLSTVGLCCIRTDQRATATTFWPQAAYEAAILDSANWRFCLGSRKLNGEGVTPALLDSPKVKLICNAKQHKENILLALKTCANSPGKGKWQRLMFWYYIFKGSVKNRFPFFHIPLNGTEVNGVKERRPFFNMMGVFVCASCLEWQSLQATGEFLWENFLVLPN